MGILMLTIAAAVLGAGIVAVQEWRPLAGIQEKAPQSEAGRGSLSASACRRCGVIESVRGTERPGAPGPGVTLRGVGDDLMSVLVVTMAALTGTRFPHGVAPAIQEITVRFDDGSSDVMKIAGEPKWERGDRVRVIQGRIHPGRS